MIALGTRLRELRRTAGLSQNELAGDELSASYVSLIEAGKRQPSPEIIKMLAERLRCSPEDLAGGHASPERRLLELEVAYARLALTHGEAASARDRLQNLIETTQKLDHTMEDEVLYLLAQAHEKTHNLAEAARVLLPVYERCLTADCHLPVATVSISLCGYYFDAGDLNATVRVGEAGLRAVSAQKLEGTDEHLRLAATLMSAYYELGDLLHCNAWADQLLGIAERSGATQGQAAVYWNAAYVAEALGNVDEALHLCDRALALMSEQGTVRDLPRLRVAAAWFILRATPARAQEAAHILDQALTDLQDLGSPVDLATWESTRSLADLLMGHPEQAEQLARQALLHLGVHPGSEAARALVTLGDSLVAQGHRDEANNNYMAAGESLRNAPMSRHLAALWREIADRLALAEQIDAALAAYRQALDSGGIRSNLASAEVAFGIVPAMMSNEAPGGREIAAPVPGTEPGSARQMSAPTGVDTARS
jgi:transcriptional regulator with XRE-family HTH domain